MSAKHELEDLLASQIASAGLPAPERDIRFHFTRKWRFDFMFRAQRIALEVDGGTWRGGRHTTGSGFREDVIKLNTATEMGWRVYRATSDMVRDGTAISLLKRVLTCSDNVSTRTGE